jgi:GrpB-like predicted nucleotidyltransferase (UPF0157 family)
MSDQEDFDRYLDEVLIGGREKRDIVVVAYDPTWPHLFDAQRERISRALGETVTGVHHVGSTAVEGLAAKPIIDIVVEVVYPDREESYVPALEQAGYVLRVREPGHLMFRTPELDVHVHLWSDPAEIRRHLLFRDWLRHSEEDRAAYQALKEGLARQKWNDMNYYARAKGDLIAAISERAEGWVVSDGWTG